MEAVVPEVSIIIPHYNQVEYLKRLLPSVANQTFNDYEVIIIDDFTPDRSTPEYIRNLIKGYPRMLLVENTENMGFVRTCNKGIELARGDYVCLLNQDTEVKRNFVQRNVEIMDADPSIGALSCIIVDKEGKNWFTGGSFKGEFMANLMDDFQGIRTVDFVAGTACFYRKEVFNKIGLFDENFGMYHEDVEFGLRIKTKTDYKACMFSEKLVVHYVVPSIPTNEKYYYAHRNHILILKTYFPKYLPKVLIYFYLREVASLLVDSVLKLDVHYISSSLCITKGILQGLVMRKSR
jgi:GT2 family glycosyltransferase